MAIHDSGNLWKSDMSSEMPHIKYADKTTQYQLKFRADDSKPIVDKELIKIVLDTLNKADPATNDSINKLLSGETKVAIVGAFKIEAMPQADVKTDNVFKKHSGPPKKDLPPAFPQLPPLGTVEKTLQDRTNKQTEKQIAATGPEAKESTAKPVPAPRPAVAMPVPKPRPDIKTDANQAKPIPPERK